MEPVTVVLGLAAIIGTGALTKIGENITDKLTQHVKNYREFLKRKAPHSNAVKALEAGESIDYGQASAIPNSDFDNGARQAGE
jgi:hypothetical protein